jgi:hypothetical protein
MVYTIYTLRPKDRTLTDCYVGSTSNFTNRKNVHKAKCKTLIHRPVYKRILETGGLDEWVFTTIVEVDSRNESLVMEGRMIDHIRPNLNVRAAIATDLEGNTCNICDCQTQHEIDVKRNRFQALAYYYKKKAERNQ